MTGNGPGPFPYVMGLLNTSLGLLWSLSEELSEKGGACIQAFQQLWFLAQGIRNLNHGPGMGRTQLAAGHVGLLRLQKHADRSLGTIYPLLKVERAPWVSCVVCSSQTQTSWDPEVQNHPCCINCTTDSTQPVIRCVVSLELNIFFMPQEKKSAQNHNLCVTYWTDCMCHTVKFEYKLSSRWPCIKTVYSGRELCPQGMLWHP